MSRAFRAYVADRWPTPEALLSFFLSEAAVVAASVEATLPDAPALDGRRQYLPSLAGKRDRRQYVRASVQTDRDGIAWPALTFGTFRHGGSTVFWSPRASAWKAFRADRGLGPAANDNAAEQARAEQAAKAAADRAQRAAERDATKAEGQRAAAVAAAAAWAAASPAEGHAYLQRKGIAGAGLRIASGNHRARLWNDDEGAWQDRVAVHAGELLVPIFDAAGDLLNLQRIQATGRKLFILGGRVIGGRAEIPGAGRTVLAEGWATGESWNAATGERVIVCFSAGNLQHVAQTVQADAIAADHDKGGAGERAALAIGLPYHLPARIGDDWNDVFLREGPEAITRHVANDNAEPVPEPWTLPDFELKGNAPTWWNKLSAAPDAATAARIAWAIARRLQLRVPVSIDLGDLLAQLRAGARPGTMHPATLAAIGGAIGRRIGARHRRALGFTGMSRAALARHRVEEVGSLPDLTPSDYRGAIVLATPMGSGKTQRVGAPFARWAQSEGTFVGMAHRQSLVRELSQRLACEHYQETPAEAAPWVHGFATCLPSLVKADHAPIIDRAEYLFVDEIAQTLRSIGAVGVTVGDRKTWPEVFAKLSERVAAARCVIAADACADDRTLRFLASCRPGEPVRIIRMAPTDDGCRVRFGFGPDALAIAYGEAMARLAEGQRLWIACGEKRGAEVAAQVLTGSGRRVLLLTADNRENAGPAAFWRDPEGVARQYDAVIASPIISSGLSIEHRGAPHFDHGFWLGSGATVTPADALQQLGRVRYLRAWTVAVTPNNAHDLDNADAMLAGMEEAAESEGLEATVSDFDAFVASIKADDARARADFAAGFWWTLEAQGFELERLSAEPEADGIAGEVAKARADVRERRIAAVLAARELQDDEARRLRDRPNPSEADTFALLRHRIVTDLGIAHVDLTRDELEAWDDGRGPRRWDRFTAALGKADHRPEAGHLSERRFQRARVLAYRQLFDGFDLGAGMRLTDADARRLLERVEARRYLLAFLGIVPAKWGRASDPPPAKYPMREVAEVFERMGLLIRRREFRSAHRCPHNPLEVMTPSVGARARHLAYELTAASWKTTAALAERRNAARHAVRAVPSLLGSLSSLWVRSLPVIGSALAALPAIGSTAARWLQGADRRRIASRSTRGGANA